MTVTFVFANTDVFYLLAGTFVSGVAFGAVSHWIAKGR